MNSRRFEPREGLSQSLALTLPNVVFRLTITSGPGTADDRAGNARSVEKHG
jgi:hypothetical protein